MKSMKKTGSIFAAAALAASLAVTGVVLLNGNTQANAEEDNEGLTYFYNKLGEDKNAKNFYKAFEKLNDTETLKTGKVEYDLVDSGTVAVSDVKDFVDNAGTRFPKAYSAGRDTFIMDHPDLFYVDLFGTSINAGTKGNDYVAYLDSSRVQSLYIGEFNSKEKVNGAIAAYESKLSEIVSAAKAEGDIVAQIKFVNKYICDHTEYSFGTEVRDGKNVDTPAAAYVNTSYGALVNGKAICGGYSKAFKAVMDRLGIPCVCIQGYSIKESGSSEAHMWNVVKLDDQWYNVDVTWNDTGSDVQQWMLLGSINFDYAHQEDSVISSSGFELSYPAVKPYDYGVDTDENNMNITGEYTTEDNMKSLKLTVVYEGKGAEKLHEEGKYLVFRYGDSEGNNIKWGSWISAVEANEVAPTWLFEDVRSIMSVMPNAEYVQFALLNRAPDESGTATYPDSAGANAGKPYYYYYKDGVTDSDFIAKPSAPYQNEGYHSYIPSPWGNPNVSNGGSLPVDQTYQFKFTYTDSLEKIDSSKGVEMYFYTSRGNDTVREQAVVSDFQWDGDKVISFTFTPSKMYIHNLTDYNFVPTNLQGVTSKKVPDPVVFSFKRKSVVCSKVFNDGRLYMNVYGEPQMLDTSDLSVTDFQDENGNYYAASQRSQLMLVVSKPDEAKEQEMQNVLLDETAIKENEIVSSATYEINLQICGVVRKVPNGSYMQVAFGFPEGYTPDDEGTTFKIYHYKHDDKGKITGIEEIPAIITEYGLIARVESFSPFTVVQIKNTSEAVTEGNKAVYASVNGNGSLTTGGKGGITLVEGNSIRYDVKAQDGYQVARIVLNGKALSADRYENGSLTLSADELNESNTLEAVFVTKESVESYAKLGIQVAGIDTLVTPDAPNMVPIIVGCVIGAIALAAGVALIVVLLKKSPAPATAAQKSSKKSTATKKTSAKKPTSKK